MRYQKPVVMDLSAEARADGQGPLGCYSGEVGSGGWGDCQYGTSGTGIANGCTTGPTPGGVGSPVCISGNTPTTDFCMTGGGGYDYGQPCLSGPAPA